MTFKFVKPFSLAQPSMYCFCVRELEKAVMELLGKTSAKYRDADPQPQLHQEKKYIRTQQTTRQDHGDGKEEAYPRSRMLMPSFSWALWT